MANRVQVIEVNEAPAIGKPQMQQGIRTKDAAVRWAEREGYRVVYLFKKYERVYADKLSKAGVSL